MLVVNDEEDLAAILVVGGSAGGGGEDALTNSGGGGGPGGGARSTGRGAFPSSGRQLPLCVFKLPLGRKEKKIKITGIDSLNILPR